MKGWTQQHIDAVNKRNGSKQVQVSEIAKKTKFNNKRAVYDGFKFDSTKEGKRYLELRQMMDMGLIKFLNMQVRFKLSVCTYVADFVYFDRGEVIVEDVKSVHTRKLPVYSIKRKMMKHELNITITEK